MNRKPDKPKRSSVDRFRILNAFVDHTAAGLRRSELLVWMTLYRDTRDNVATSSQRDIARRCGVDRKTVERAVTALVRRGLLVVVRSGGFRKGTASYRVMPVDRETARRLDRSTANP